MQQDPNRRNITRHYNPKETCYHLIGDFKLLSPWNKFKINIIQLRAEWGILSHNLSQQQTLHNNYKFSDPHHNVAWREMYHPQVVKSMRNRVKTWIKITSFFSAISLFVVYPIVEKTLEIERKRRDLFISQRNTFIKEKSL